MSNSFKNVIDGISSKVNDLSKKMLNEFKLPPYHYIELFIYFNNFIEEELIISKASFITANSSLIQSETIEEIATDPLSNQIYRCLSSNEIIPLYALCAYLKTIAINGELNDDILLEILDKNSKGYIDYSDIEILISSLEEFCNEHKDWANFEESFTGKKLTKRNLQQNDFNKEIFDLFAKCNDIIEQRTAKSFNNYKGGFSYNNNNENIVNKNNAVDINKVHFAFENMNYITIPNKSIYEMIFDDRKAEMVHKIKMASLLYDVTLSEFIKEFSKYEKTKCFDKEQFITILNEIIEMKTSNLLQSQSKKLALSMLFQYIDVEVKNSISYYEALGGIFTLTRTTKDDIMNLIFSFPKKIVNQVITGMLSIYVNTNVVKDVSIFSELCLTMIKDLGIIKGKEFITWINNDKDDFHTYENKNNNLNDSINTTHSIQLINTIENLNEKYNLMKNRVNIGLNWISIIDITQELIKHSLLGEINNIQLSCLLDCVINEKYADKDSKEKKKAKSDCMELIEKYFDFSQNELIDITNLHSFFLLLFSGSTVEKMQSIFIINDINVNECIDYNDLMEYFSHMFEYLLKEMGILNINAKELASTIMDVFAKGKQKISLVNLIQFYESVLQE